ncbi:glycosyl transferase family 1 [Pontibacter virosus]|uniref:Glycosyl transferase family 1 n=2 Tax=Pontibacter virosus TaxID=1765052 RepID=A0A2U1AQL1_9BACT|nr:glycosyl transferase family 1 [Pontibacter virosus]
MSIVVSHPTGNANVRAVLSALYAAELLAEFNTTLAFNSEAAWLKYLPQQVRSEFLRRTFPVAHHKVKTHPVLEAIRLGSKKINLSRAVHLQKWVSTDSVYTSFDKAVASRLTDLVARYEVKAVYAYEDGALATFKRAKVLGLKCVYDLPIAYWETSRRLMMEEKERLPQWSGTLDGLSDSEEKLNRKTQEMELADLVVTPSQFVRDSLPPWSLGKDITMSPFGSPDVQFYRGNMEKKWDRNLPLRVLFVGSMTQRKGLGDLFGALKLLRHTPIELIVMGSLQASMDFYRKELPTFNYEPCRPHQQVLKLMQSCDLLCLPSIVEGRALVMQEAMSQGLPLVITPNTGGSDLILEGETGFLVPIQSPEAIAEKLMWFVNNRALIPEMSRKTKEHVKSYTWDRYGDRIVTSLDINSFNSVRTSRR